MERAKTGKEKRDPSTPSTAAGPTFGGHSARPHNAQHRSGWRIASVPWWSGNKNLAVFFANGRFPINIAKSNRRRLHFFVCTVHFDDVTSHHFTAR